MLVLAMLLTLSCNSDDSRKGCMENPGQGKLFVFVGQKIEVKKVAPDKRGMDEKFIAKYKILENVCGSYNKDAIEFLAYDHYGRPGFERVDPVLLYVMQYEGIFYHEKYQYNDLYLTKDGRWAGPYSPLNHQGYRDTSVSRIMPVRIDFAKEVSYNIANWKQRDIRERFPKPYYRIEGEKAIALYGNYIPELFELKKKGVFTARGLYSNTDATNEIKFKPVEMAVIETVALSKKETKELTEAWIQLYGAILEQQTLKIKSMALDSVVCSVCEGFRVPSFYNDREPIDSFIAAAYRNLPGTELARRMKTGDFEIKASRNEQLVTYEVVFPILTRYEDMKYQLYHRFEFIKVGDKFTFKGMSTRESCCF